MITGWNQLFVYHSKVSKLLPVLNISQPDSLLPHGHLVMFHRVTLQGQTGLEHELLLNILFPIQNLDIASNKRIVTETLRFIKDSKRFDQ